MKQQTLKEKVIALCEKYNVPIQKIRYYKESPYENRRFKDPSEEVWLYVNHSGWTEKICINAYKDGDGQELERNFCGYIVPSENWPDFINRKKNNILNR